MLHRNHKPKPNQAMPRPKAARDRQHLSTTSSSSSAVDFISDDDDPSRSLAKPKSLAHTPRRPSASTSTHHTAARSSSISLAPDEHPDLHPRRSSLSLSRPSPSTLDFPSSSSSTCAASSSSASSSSASFTTSNNPALLSAHPHSHAATDKHLLSPIPASPLPLKRNLSDLSTGYNSDSGTSNTPRGNYTDSASTFNPYFPPFSRSSSPSRQRAFSDPSRRPMTIAPPRMRSPAGKSSSSRSRRAILVLVVLLALIVLGTFIVLSSVSYALYIPAGAFLTEAEVPWKESDVIRKLYNANDTKVASMVEAAAAKHMISSGDDAEDVDTETYSVTPHNDGPEWGIDGKGTGGYWMREGWDGTVHNTSSWDRLYEIKVRDGEKIPRIIHQTWKSDVLPDKWRTAWKECREGMPDYEYMLWTDDLSRKFIEEHYPEELKMFDEYKYPIQRADAIRYFILHHFGGVYMDLDIGCRRRMDPLLQGEWDTVLALTKPVGVSNDLIFSARNSPFMEQTIKGLKNFNHEWVINYPTVMFSTGPMFLSAEYSFWQSAHPISSGETRAVRVLPKSLYGKNAPQDTVPHSFFSHFYGSSWHADDAGFIAFLGTWGKGLLWVACALVVLGVLRLIWSKWFSPGGSLRLALPNNNDYQVLPVSTPMDGLSGPSSPTQTPYGPLSPVGETPAWRRMFAGSVNRPSPRTPHGSSSWFPWMKETKRNRRGSDAAGASAGPSSGSKREEVDEEKELMNDW